MINNIRAFFRLCFFAIGSTYYITRCLLKSVFNGLDLDHSLPLRMSWFKKINKGIGVQIETYGTPPTDPGLIVCNHRSYFDPIVVLSQMLALPVGKSEVATWPIIGLGAKVSGVIFVERKTKEGRQKARENILETLKRGYFVINYPEGTTHSNAQTIDFKPGMFKDASTEGFFVYPVAIEYQKTADAWVGDDTFLRHFFECFGKKNTYIRISYGPKLQSDNIEELMQDSKQWLDKELLRLRAGWHESEMIGMN